MKITSVCDVADKLPLTLSSNIKILLQKSDTYKLLWLPTAHHVSFPRRFSDTYSLFPIIVLTLESRS